MTGIILYTLAFVLLILSFLKDKSKTIQAIKSSLKSFENIMPQFLGIIIFVGLLLSLLNPETISKLIGNESGFFGVLISSLIGSVVLMPTFVAFSTGNSLLQNGAGFAQVGALISTLTLVGVMTFSLESKYIGTKASFLRNFIAFLFSFVVAFILGKVMVVI